MQAVLLALTLFAAADAPRTTEVDEAVERVKQIVNQPVRSYPRGTNAPVALYSPGWFHEGAIVPDFRAVDVRRTQQFPYDAHEWVTSDLNPGLMFRGRDLEFNSMTKYFYTDRSVPKKRLTEAEMVEINRLYRTIAMRMPQALAARPPAPPAAAAARSTRALGYGSAVVLVLALVMWLYRRRSARAR